ncbi:hypothetical protein [Mesorhizobium sp. 1M-11]|uniref:hypothetical protein n=1 Tax=Mesorhizobium sp. 1M-11 TaxID=1529006 RepID=UPI0006C76893|nr:hypothetical protein [Mesorhizobium sp. 1M-11]
MRHSAAMVIVSAVLFCTPAFSEDLKAYKLTVDGVSVDIDPGEDATLALPNGKQARVKLEPNAFATFSGGNFSFVHPSGVTVTKTNLSKGLDQHLMASAVGSMVIVQEYSDMNPVMLNQLMLQEITKESVRAGGKLTQKAGSRKLADGKVLNGLSATVKTRIDRVAYEVMSYGTTDQGVIVITSLDDDNAEADQPMIDRFWQSLKLRMDE